MSWKAVVEQVRHWRDELLNLTRRDCAIYYRPTRAASLLVEEPNAAEVIDVLRAARSPRFHSSMPTEELLRRRAWSRGALHADFG